MAETCFPEMQKLQMMACITLLEAMFQLFFYASRDSPVYPAWTQTLHGRDRRDSTTSLAISSHGDVAYSSLYPTSP